MLFYGANFSDKSLLLMAGLWARGEQQLADIGLGLADLDAKFFLNVNVKSNTGMWVMMTAALYLRFEFYFFDPRSS